jgi:hypothetical protein
MNRSDMTCNKNFSPANLKRNVNTFDPASFRFSINNSNSDRDQKSQLPHDFIPSAYSVLIGRGRACTEATGNKRLKVIISIFLEEYSSAQTRIAKSMVVSKIVDMVRDACPVGAFIKQERGVWWEVSDSTARERVGSILRDLLHEQYKSSSKSKLARRRRSMQTTEGELTAKKDFKYEPRNKPSRISSSVAVDDEGSTPRQSKLLSTETGKRAPREDESTRVSIAESSLVDAGKFARIDVNDVLTRICSQEQSSNDISMMYGKSDKTSPISGSARIHQVDDCYPGKPKHPFDTSWLSSFTNNTPYDPCRTLQQQKFYELQQQNRQRQSILVQQQQLLDPQTVESACRVESCNCNNHKQSLVVPDSSFGPPPSHEKEMIQEHADARCRSRVQDWGTCCADAMIDDTLVDMDV